MCRCMCGLRFGVGDLEEMRKCTYAGIGFSARFDAVECFGSHLAAHGE